MHRILALALAFILLTSPMVFAASGKAGGNTTTPTTSTSTSTSTTSSTFNTNVGNVVIGEQRTISASGCFGTATFSGSRVSNQSDLELLLYGASTYTTSGQWAQANRFSDSDLCQALGHGDVFYNSTPSPSYMGQQTARNLDATRYSRTDTSTQVSTEVTTTTVSITVGDFSFGTNTIVNTNTNTNTNYDKVYEHLTGTGVVNVYEVNTTYRYSPIVLDLSRTGRLDASNGNWMPHNGIQGKRLAFFDLMGHGNPLLTEWVGPKAGLLIEPRVDGTVDGTCLFGNAGGYDNGYEKLSVRDKNNDGRLTGAELNGLAVWVDANSNAKVDANEIKSLKALGITELSVRHRGMRSTFVMNGKSEMMWDWWPTALDVRQVAQLKK